MPRETRGSFPAFIWASVGCFISSHFSAQRIYTNEDLFYEVHRELNLQVRGPYSVFKVGMEINERDGQDYEMLLLGFAACIKQYLCEFQDSDMF